MVPKDRPASLWQFWSEATQGGLEGSAPPLIKRHMVPKDRLANFASLSFGTQGRGRTGTPFGIGV